MTLDYRRKTKQVARSEHPAYSSANEQNKATFVTFPGHFSLYLNLA
jgi:hypothetical protein